MSNINTIIIGGGLSGLTVAHKLQHNCPDHTFVVLEKNSHTGGCIKSHQEQGFISEIGPHGFLDNCQESKDLLAETDLDKECVQAPLIDFVRYVYLHEKLNLIPQTPKKIIMAPLVPWKDKFRVLADIWKSPLSGEPTVAQWVSHRFGKALLPYVDAVFTGTYAGDLNKLKIDAVMPGVRQLERDHGSVIRGIIAKMIKKKREGNSQKIAMPAMTSFPEGMERLVQKLTEKIKQTGQLRLDAGVEGIEKTQTGWDITIHNGETLQAENIVLAVPVNVSLQLLKKVYSSMPMKSIPEAWIASVIFGYDNNTLPPGFGFLTPEVENKFSLGTLFSSNMFPGRAPDGSIVFETLIGGRRHPEKLELSNFDLIKYAKKDAEEILNMKGEPKYIKVLRPTAGIPQLEAGYPELLEWKNSISKKAGNLHICGFGWGGIGINDMIKHATKIAEKIQTGITQKEEVEVKKVYF